MPLDDTTALPAPLVLDVPAPPIPEIALIDRAVGYIRDPKHWCKGDVSRVVRERVGLFRHRLVESVCAVGVLNQEAFGGARVWPESWWRESTYMNVFYALRTGAEARGFCGKTSVAHFNDHPATTHADVLALFAEARQRLLQERG